MIGSITAAYLAGSSPSNSWSVDNPDETSKDLWPACNKATQMNELRIFQASWDTFNDSPSDDCNLNDTADQKPGLKVFSHISLELIILIRIVYFALAFCWWRWKGIWYICLYPCDTIIVFWGKGAIYIVVFCRVLVSPTTIAPSTISFLLKLIRVFYIISEQKARQKAVYTDWNNEKWSSILLFFMIHVTHYLYS